MKRLSEHVRGTEVIHSHRLEVTFFVKDANKPGGSYQTHRGIARTVDEAACEIIFADGRYIPFSSIVHITGIIFKDIESRE